VAVRGEQAAAAARVGAFRPCHWSHSAFRPLHFTAALQSSCSAPPPPPTLFPTAPPTVASPPRPCQGPAGPAVKIGGARSAGARRLPAGCLGAILPWSRSAGNGAGAAPRHWSHSVGRMPRRSEQSLSLSLSLPPSSPSSPSSLHSQSNGSKGSFAAVPLSAAAERDGDSRALERNPPGHIRRLS